MAPRSTNAPAGQSRNDALRELRRKLIIDAARTVFGADGLEGASMRAIAAAAGCTTGAIYPHFQGKEELYGAVLSQSLDALDASIARRMARKSRGRDAARSGLRAFFDYYRARPDDLSLGLYLNRGIRPAGLNAELDKALNRQLREIFARIDAEFQTGGAADPAARTAAAIAQAVGLLVLEQTGRLALFGRKAPSLFTHYLDGL